MHRLASLAAAVLLCSCGTLPKGLTPKPDIRPIQESQARIQASVGKARENLTKERDSEHKVDADLARASAALKQAAASKAVSDAQAALADVQRQRAASAQYREWADTELANSWRYLGDAKQQITVLSGQIDTSHQNEAVAVAAVEKWKPIIDQVNSWWGLGAFAYGLKRLASHLLILSLILGGLGLVVFFIFPAAIPVVLGLFRKVSSLVGSLFRKN